MLEYALRMERYALQQIFFIPPFQTFLPSSKQLNQSAPPSVPPSKLAAIQTQNTGNKDDQAKEDSSGSSPRSEGPVHCSSPSLVPLLTCFLSSRFPTSR